jgi:hypothetical protein
MPEPTPADDRTDWAEQWHERVDRLAKVLTEHAELSHDEQVARATALVARMRCADLREVAVGVLLHDARSIVRVEALRVERAAAGLAEPRVDVDAVLAEARERAELTPQEWARREVAKELPPDAGELWKGRYRHGSTDKQRGAAVRGCPCEECQRVRDIDERAFARLVKGTRATVDAYAEQLRMEWTAELLATPFALPDGSRTTWGAATVGQHRERVAMFEGQAHTAIEGAARHVVAILELEAAGASCLADLLAARS